MNNCPTRFTLAQYRAGDLPAQTLSEVETHLEDCATCAEVIDGIDANIDAYAPHLEADLDRLQERVASSARVAPVFRRQRTLRVIRSLGGLAALLLIAFTFARRYMQRPVPAESDPVVHFKGAAGFEAYARRGNDQFKVSEATPLRGDDQMRFVITAPSAGYISLVSMDEDGSIAPFYPSSRPAADSSAFEIANAGRHELPGSIVLDHAGRDKYFVLVFSRNPFNRADAHSQVQQQHSRLENEHYLELDNGLIIRRIAVTKQ